MPHGRSFMHDLPRDPSRVDELLRGPTSAALLGLASTLGLTVSDLGDARTAFAVAIEAARIVNPWAVDDFASQLAAVVADAARLRPLADEIAYASVTAWWWESPDLEAQHAVLSRREGRDRVRAAPDPGIGRWELYAQMPYDAIVTSTIRGGTSSLCAAIAAPLEDYDDVEWVTLCKALVPVGVPVFSIHGPRDWHELCLASPVYVTDNPLHVRAMTPDWVDVARRFSAVHISFGGWLSTRWRVNESAGHTSLLWTWNNEQTIWLRRIVTLTEPRPFLASDHVPMLPTRDE